MESGHWGTVTCGRVASVARLRVALGLTICANGNVPQGSGLQEGVAQRPQQKGVLQIFAPISKKKKKSNFTLTYIIL